MGIVNALRVCAHGIVNQVIDCAGLSVGLRWVFTVLTGKEAPDDISTLRAHIREQCAECAQKELEEAEEAERVANKEREEAEAAEAAAAKEREEAEAAERELKEAELAVQVGLRHI